MTSSQPPDFWPPSDDSDPQGGELERRLGPEELLDRMSLESAQEHLMKLCRNHVNERAKLMDPIIVGFRSAAGVAVALTGVWPLQWVHGIPAHQSVGDKHGKWIGQRVAEALEDLLAEDQEALAEGYEQPDDEEPRHQYLIDWFKLEPYAVLAAAVRFNRLPDIERHSFFLVFVHSKPMDDCLGLGLGDPKDIRKQAEAALRVIIDPPPPESPIDLQGLDLP